MKTTQKMNAELAEIFERFDLNNDGGISENEFGLLLQALGEDIPRTNLSLHFEVIDANGDGVVDFKEFVDWWLDYEK